mmetsp:Transcript_28344/g.65734  ORF Transcript_28344/g.65734 Transcript_28344/m.65734 type:complete len:211 (+) Transcript_28344:1704-2336(+)
MLCDTEGIVLARVARSKSFLDGSRILREETSRIQVFDIDRLSDIHDPISGVVILGVGVAVLGEVIRNSADCSLVHDTALVHENQVVKGVENFGCGLMDGKEHTGTGIGDLLEDLAKLHSREGVKSRSGFIEKDESGLGDEFDSDTGALAFSTGDSLDEGSSHNGVSTLGQSEFFQHPFRQFVELAVGGGTCETELGRESDGLTGRCSDLK